MLDITYVKKTFKEIYSPCPRCNHRWLSNQPEEKRKICRSCFTVFTEE